MELEGFEILLEVKDDADEPVFEIKKYPGESESVLVSKEEISTPESLDDTEDSQGEVANEDESDHLVDSPENIEEKEPSRTVMQYIDNTFHRWSEYELESGEMCIVLEKPEYKQLAEDEARRLLEESSKWKEQVPETDQGYTLEPDDPKLDVSPVPMPREDESQVGINAVIGEDERERVQDDYEVESHPWHTIGYIHSIYDEYDDSRGTGFLVGPHTIFTNAHVVYDEDRDGFVDNLEFSPAQYEDGEDVIRPYGTQEAREIGEDNIDANYLEVGNFDYDYAVAYIDEPFEDIDTYMPLEFNFEEPEETVIISGYPGEAQGEDTFDQWYSEDEIHNIGDRRLEYYVDTSGGQSGSPVRVDRGTGERIVAFHAYGADSYNGGPRLVDENQDLIEDWMVYEKPYTLSIDETIEDSGSYTAELTADADNAEQAFREHDFELN